MIYVWKHIETGVEVEVSRPVAEIDRPPTVEESQIEGGTWERIVSLTPIHRRNAWGSKGNWGKVYGGVRYAPGYRG